MLSDPKYWRDYYRGDENDVRLSRFYSYSDRCRYYWPDAQVQKGIRVLMENLTSHPPAMTLVSQYLPLQYEAIRAGALLPLPADIVQGHIRHVLGKYAKACDFKSI